MCNDLHKCGSNYVIIIRKECLSEHFINISAGKKLSQTLSQKISNLATHCDLSAIKMWEFDS